MDVAGKVVVVTGGANGIGRAMVERFAAEGPKGIVVADLDGAGAQSVAGSVDGLAVGCDVADRNQVRALIASAEDEFGPVDLFCANAGVSGEPDLQAPPEAWQQAWDVNVMAHVHAAQILVPAMVERGEGYLLHTASAAGLLINIGAAAYTVTKHAVVGLAEWLAVTYGDAGVGVSCLCPMGVRTDMLMAGADDAAGATVLAQGAIEPAEVASAVIDGLADERFLILPHPEVAEFFVRKADDHDRWLSGMRRLQQSIVDSLG